MLNITKSGESRLLHSTCIHLWQHIVSYIVFMLFHHHSALSLSIRDGCIVAFKQRWMQNTDCHRRTGGRAVHIHSPDKDRRIPFCLPSPTAWLSHGRQRGEDGYVVARWSRWLPASLSFSCPPLILLPPVEEEDALAHPSSCPPSLQNAARRSFVLNGTGHLHLESVRCLFFFPLKSSGSHLYPARRCLLSDWMSQSQSDTYGRSILNIYIWWLHKPFLSFPIATICRNFTCVSWII